MLLEPIGEAGQGRLRASHALIVGCGALGTASAELLCRAGVGRLTLVDRDLVEWTNLQRQSLYDERDARESTPKAEAARRRLAEINSSIAIAAHVMDVSPSNAERLLSESPRVDVIVDGTDNFETRYLLNDLAVKHDVPWIYAGAVGLGGMSMTIRPGTSPCLRCVFDEPPEPGSRAAGATCDTVGVFAPLTAIIGAVQAAEAIKILAGRQDEASTHLLTLDAWTAATSRLDLSRARRPDCPCCGARRFEFLSGERGSSSARLCGRSSVQVHPERAGHIDLPSLRARLSPHGAFEASRFLVRGVLMHERGQAGATVTLTVFADGRAIIAGIEQVEHARAIYARYVGA